MIIPFPEPLAHLAVLPYHILVNRLFLETLEGVRVIRAFNRQKHEMDRFDETNGETARISLNAVTVSGLMMPTVNMLFGIASAGAMAVGTVLVVNGEIDVRSCKLYREIAGIQLGASLTVCHTVVFLHGYFIGEGFAHCGKFGGG